MKLLDITRFCSRLDEAIDIHGLQRRFEENPSIDKEAVSNAVKEYRASLQARKKDLLKPFGLDDLDKFKDDPVGFVKAVEKARVAFAAQREDKALYRRVYEDDRCLVAMPKGPRGAASAGSLYKRDRIAVCPWCVATKYPDSVKWWKQYRAAAVFFVYAKDGGVVSNAWCLVLRAQDALNTIAGKPTLSQIEGVKNTGRGNLPDAQAETMRVLFSETGIDGETLERVLKSALMPGKRGFEAMA